MPVTGSALKVTPRGDREIVLTRDFDAPRDLVFKAMTDPKLISSWWGPRRYETIVDKYELRPGGAWRFINRAADGGEHAFRGVFREIVPPRKIVWTFEYEPLAGHISVETCELEEVGGKTRMTAVSVFDNREDRDGMLQSGMESGASESYDRLDEVLAELTRKPRT